MMPLLGCATSVIFMMGLLGFIGLGGLWFSSLGAFGAFGALGLHNHQRKRYAKLAYLAGSG